MVSRTVPLNRQARFRSSALVAEAICAVALLAVLCAACNQGKGDVVANGDLSHGKGGDSPDGWQSIQGLPGRSTLRWHHEPDIVREQFDVTTGEGAALGLQYYGF